MILIPKQIQNTGLTEGGMLSHCNRGRRNTREAQSRIRTTPRAIECLFRHTGADIPMAIGVKMNTHLTPPITAAQIQEHGFLLELTSLSIRDVNCPASIREAAMYVRSVHPCSSIALCEDELDLGSPSRSPLGDTDLDLLSIWRG
jgi:hypothetical protein